MLGDGSAPEYAERVRKHDVVIGAVRGGRGGQRRLRVGVAGDGHHRNRRHPGLVRLVLAGIHGLGKVAQLVGCGPCVIRGWSPERRRAELAAAGRVAEQLEPSAERSQRGEIGVAGTAGLSGLAGEAGQCLRRRRKASHQEAGQNRSHPNCGDEPEMPWGGRTPVNAPHRAPPQFGPGIPCGRTGANRKTSRHSRGVCQHRQLKERAAGFKVEAQTISLTWCSSATLRLCRRAHLCLISTH